MLKNIPLYIGLRYTRAKRRNQFISFISAFSLVGMALGVMALIIVLSVMNGFGREMHERILSVIPHGFIDQLPALDDWQELSAQVNQHPQVVASAPYIASIAMVNYAGGVDPIELQGILPEAEAQVSIVDQRMLVGSMAQLQPGEYGIVMGRILAARLMLTPGDKIRIISPEVNITPMGAFTRSRSFTLVGVFEVGAQVDSTLALIHVQDAQKFLRKTGVQGLHVKTDNMFTAAKVMSELRAQLGDNYRVKDWSQTQGSLFQAVKMEKIVVGALLMIIIAVAAFNIVSSLVLMVADKRSDIAVLRTMGVSARQIMAIFIVQGSAVGFFGTFIGTVVGCIVASSLTPIMNAVESMLGMQVFDPDVYFITQLPSVLLWQDVALICGVALLLSFIATLYPAYRAAQIEPAEALRYE
ncbi:lipoprotein-releasing ABC transporter permease subunit [Cellvibrio sp. OA-2007]|uniref:lipoprotein-releasing ABC transporter permease subunit n=1 Tax=Cellvibrio sp. OA-2007 TaxID=529823 RepID=UPI00078027BB|nr:lipoprotein-releasing ABC transporter permease subunit [Cellvibrio sp. OA-2007]